LGISKKSINLKAIWDRYWDNMTPGWGLGQECSRQEKGIDGQIWLGYVWFA
jgi:hypothetical protein